MGGSPLVHFQCLEPFLSCVTDTLYGLSFSWVSYRILVVTIMTVPITPPLSHTQAVLFPSICRFMVAIDHRRMHTVWCSMGEHDHLAGQYCTVLYYSPPFQKAANVGQTFLLLGFSAVTALSPKEKYRATVCSNRNSQKFQLPIE